MIEKEIFQDLKTHATRARKDIANMFYKWGHGHFGGAYSCVEILSELYFRVMRVDPQNPKWEDRDRFIMSKGHGAAALFTILAQRGFFPENWLAEYGDLSANLNTHPSMGRVPGLDFSSGSLGHGLPAGMGMAYAAKMDGKDFRTFVLLGDGECDEGMIWEAALAAPHYKLDNLVAIVDRNRLFIAGNTEDCLPLEPFREKWESFRWEVFEADGHDFESLSEAFDAALASKNGKPKVLIANTVKGKGVSFMENNYKWHAGKCDAEIHESIIKELDQA